jgi:anti-sigma B factor antagonist
VVKTGVGQLEIAVEAGVAGPMVVLFGECDVSTADQLGDALRAITADGAVRLSIDLSALRFADSASFQVIIEAHHALRGAGGTLELLRPQPAVAQVIRLLGVDQVLTIRTETGTGDHPAIP